MSETPTPPHKPPAAGKPDTREARLAAALRTNLRRRKADRAAPVPAADGADDGTGDGSTAQASAIPATKSPQDGS